MKNREKNKIKRSAGSIALATLTSLLMLAGTNQASAAPTSEKAASDVKVSSEVLMVWKDKDGKVHSKLVKILETSKSYLVKKPAKEFKKQG